MIRRALFAVWLASIAAACAGSRVAAPREGEKIYVVRRGDTAWAVARRHGVRVETLTARNGLSDPAQITVGQRLVVPAAASKASRPTHPEPPEVQLPEVPPMSTRVEKPPPPSTLKPSPEAGSAALIWPVDGVVTSLFGRREGERHDGVDIAAPVGTAVWAARAGKVLYAGEQPGYGLLVILDHEDSTVTIYAHNHSNLVEEGAEVVQGQPIAQVGTSGGSTSPALHFEIRKNRQPINPLPRLPR